MVWKRVFALVGLLWFVLVACQAEPEVIEKEVIVTRLVEKVVEVEGETQVVTKVIEIEREVTVVQEVIVEVPESADSDLLVEEEPFAKGQEDVARPTALPPREKEAAEIPPETSGQIISALSGGFEEAEMALSTPQPTEQPAVRAVSIVNTPTAPPLTPTQSVSNANTLNLAPTATLTFAQTAETAPTESGTVEGVSETEAAQDHWLLRLIQLFLNR